MSAWNLIFASLFIFAVYCNNLLVKAYEENPRLIHVVGKGRTLIAFILIIIDIHL